MTDAVSRRSTFRRLPIAAWLALGLSVLLCCPLEAQKSRGPSFFELKRSFENARKTGTPEQQHDALADLAALGEVTAFRFALEELEDLISLHAKAMAVQMRAGDARNQARRTFQQARARKEDTKEAERQLKLAEEAYKEATTVRERSADTLLLLRRGLGWIVQDLSKRDAGSAARSLASTYKRERDVLRQLDLAQAAVWVDHEAISKIFDRKLKRGSGPEKVAVLRAWLTRGGSGAIPYALATLDDEAWQVRASAIEVLGHVGGLQAAEALADRLPKEDGRLRTDVIGALRTITGQDFKRNVHLWRDWLAKEGGSLEEPTEETNAKPRTRAKGPVAGGGKDGTTNPSGEPAGGGFYGIESDSKRPIFIIDCSGSMASPLGPRYGRKPGEPAPAVDTGPIKLNGKRKIDGVGRQLIKAVNALPSDALFGVVLFRSDVSVWNEELIRATAENKATLKAWVLTQRPTGGTNLYGGLERAFEMAGRGTFDRSYKTSADTIFLLSDGSPSAGRLQQTAPILEAASQANELRRIAIHTIGLGRTINVALLRGLAERNSGVFVHIR